MRKLTTACMAAMISMCLVTGTFAQDKAGAAEAADVDQNVAVLENIQGDAELEGQYGGQEIPNGENVQANQTAQKKSAMQIAKEYDALKSLISSKNRGLEEGALNNVIASIRSASTKHGVEKELVAAIMWQESNFDLSLAHNNCIGPMQIHKNTGKRGGLSMKQLYNSDANINFGARYISNFIVKYDGDVGKALSAYNQGPVRVDRGSYSTKYQERVFAKLKAVRDYQTSYIAEAKVESERAE